MDVQSVITEKTRNFRSLARKHVVGSSEKNDWEYMNRFKDIHNASNFVKKDNLLLDSPSRLLQITSFSENLGLDEEAGSIHVSPAQSHITVTEVALTNLAVTSGMIKKNLPIPPTSLFLAEIEKENPKQKKKPDKEIILLEPDICGLFVRSYLVESFDRKEYGYIYGVLGSVDPKLVDLYQTRANQLFRDFVECKGANLKVDPNFITKQQEKLKKMTKRKDLGINTKDLPCVEFGKLDSKLITLGSSKEDPCLLQTEYKHEIMIRNRRKKVTTITIQMDERTTPDFDVRIEPGVNQPIELKKGQALTITVFFTAHRPLRIAERLIFIEVVGGRRIFYLVKAYVESKVFGLDPELLERVNVPGIGKIPRVLEHMKNELIEHDGLNTVGLFRKAGHETKMKDIRAKFDNEDYIECISVNDFATLIKIWFREMPVKIFDFYSTEYFQKLNAKNTGHCLDTLNGLPETSRFLINWLMDLMMKVEENSAINKMTPTNLAIVFSPNLYEMKQRNPQEMMMMTQKMSQFFETVLELKIAQTRGEKEKAAEEVEGEEEEGEGDDDDDDDEEDDEDKEDSSSISLPPPVVVEKKIMRYIKPPPKKEDDEEDEGEYDDEDDDDEDSDGYEEEEEEEGEYYEVYEEEVQKQ